MSATVRLALLAPLLCAAAPPCTDPADWNGAWLTEQGAGMQISGFLANDHPYRAHQRTVRQAYVSAEGLDRLVMDAVSNDRTALEDGPFAILPPGDEQ